MFTLSNCIFNLMLFCVKSIYAILQTINLTTTQSGEKTMPKILTLPSLLSLLLLSLRRGTAVIAAQEKSTVCFETLDPTSIFVSHDNRLAFSTQSQAEGVIDELKKKCNREGEPPQLSFNSDDCPDLLPVADDKDSYCQQAGFFGFSSNTQKTFTHEYRMIDDSAAQACVQQVLKNDNCDGMPHFSYTLWQGILVYGATGTGLTLLCCLCSKEKSSSPATNMSAYGSTDEDQTLEKNLLEASR